MCSQGFTSKAGVQLICEFGVTLLLLQEFAQNCHVLYEIAREKTFFDEVSEALTTGAASEEELPSF